MSKKLFDRLIKRASTPVPKELDKQRHPESYTGKQTRLGKTAGCYFLQKGHSASMEFDIPLGITGENSPFCEINNRDFIPRQPDTFPSSPELIDPSKSYPAQELEIAMSSLEWLLVEPPDLKLF